MVKVLAVYRCKSWPKPILKETVVGKKAMSKGEKKARRMLEVTIMFEPSRLSAAYLADAYAQLVPLRKRSKQLDNLSKRLDMPSEESQWREQV